MTHDSLSRREFVAGSAVIGATILLSNSARALPADKRTFAILHTNDMHSSFIGMGPSPDYSPFTLGDDATRGGYARLAGLIGKRREALKDKGPVLVLDAGDYSMGTAFGAASRETGGELRLMARVGYDATTFGNHEFDLGPDGLGKSIGVAAKAGPVPAVLASNTHFATEDAALAELKRLAKEGVLRRYVVIERGGLRFGLFGVLGKEAQFYSGGAAPATFGDAIETGKELVKLLRETEKVDVVIALSHGGLEKDKDGKYTDGDDVRLAREVPGIDVVIGGHSHTELREAILVNGRTPVVQAGSVSQNLGELVITIEGDKLTVDSYTLHAIDDTVAGDRAVADEIEQLKSTVTSAVFASRG
jgi:5'-nucleotidase / UDP-sugar diphosphatase